MILKIFLFFVVFSHVRCDEYDDKVTFNVSMASKSVVWDHTKVTLASLGCDKAGKIAIHTHGWMGNGGEWIQTLTENLLKYRGGCVIHMDWGEFAKSINYFKVRWTHWPKVSSLLTRKLVQLKNEGYDPAKIYMYGHSLGARMVVDAAINFGTNQIGMIDACDPAGPEFYLYDATVDSKKAAKNVQIIHTSIDAGTMTRRAHQNFIMGECGVSQPASKTLKYLCQQSNICQYNNETEADISHSLCNDFYNYAFENPFVAKNTYGCLGCVDVKTLPAGYAMGYNESRTPAVRGIIPVPTSKTAPYNVV